MESEEFFKITDVAFSVLLNADDQTLGRLCQQNRAYNAICQSELFWRRRSEDRLGHLLKLRSFFPSWRDFYLTARRPAVYLVTSGEDIGLFSTIDRAYQAFLESIGAPPNLGIDQISKIPHSRHYQSGIYLVFVGDEIVLDDQQRLLLSRGANSFTAHPQLFQLPDLRTRGRFIVYYLPEEPGAIGVDYPSSALIEKLASIHEWLFNDHFSIETVDHDGLDPDLYWYQPDSGIFYRSDEPSLIIDRVNGQFMMALMPDEYHKLLEGHRFNIDIDYYESNRDEFRWEPVENLLKYPPDPGYLVDLDPQFLLDEFKLPPVSKDELRRFLDLMWKFQLGSLEYLGYRPISTYRGRRSYQDLVNDLATKKIVSYEIRPRFTRDEDYFRHNALYYYEDSDGKHYATIVNYNPSTRELNPPIRV